jgi:hypothetical protein
MTTAPRLSARSSTVAAAPFATAFQPRGVAIVKSPPGAVHVRCGARTAAAWPPAAIAIAIVTAAAAATMPAAIPAISAPRFTGSPRRRSRTRRRA